MKTQLPLAPYQFHIGDRVVVDAGLLDNDSSLFYQGPETGTILTICGFDQWYRYISHNELGYGIDRESGIYLHNGNPIGKFSDRQDGKYVELDCRVLRLLDREASDKDDPEVRASFETGVKIAPLPETPFIAGDRVRVRPEARYDDGELVTDVLGTDPFFVEAIDYAWSVKHARIRLNDGGSTTVPMIFLTLEARGNYYWWEHDRSKLKFKTLQEEVHFYLTLGKFKQLRSPTTNNYRWGQKEVFRAILEGIGDVGDDLYFSPAMRAADKDFPKLWVISEDLADLKKRCREHYEAKRAWAYSEPLFTEFDDEQRQEEERFLTRRSGG